jgi:hypothetical protein
VSTIYRTRFPEADRVAAGSKLRVRVSKAQRPDSFEVAAYRTVDEEGEPSGEGRLLKRSLSPSRWTAGRSPGTRCSRSTAPVGTTTW